MTYSKGNKRYSYFVCYGYSKGKCLSSNSVNVKMIEEAVLQSIKETLESSFVSFRYVRPESEISADVSSILAEQLKKIEEKFDRVKEAYRNGIDTLEEYKRNKDLIQKEKDSLETQLEAAKKENEEKVPDQSIMLERIKNVYQLLEGSADPVLKNEVLKSIIEKIVYIKEEKTVKIYYYYKT